ncbi:putative membrane protein YdjX (TVP38/TMEM64 family) [Tahibacter aquaticus]|uniref:TVP38/TMEM64 family membrane protein n=1 Tax=Tahibacter aquaticus TaxID=520092 RepID=A0A4R6YW64_9GAMM|nr:VTT domain-containing protein [Tahibacter aquaticus]TDR43066.1 putative membrane protein YdjX (TVP38/TMEM64 family) [Tahibacter aquaticus]
MKRLRSLLPLLVLAAIGIAVFASGVLERLSPEALYQQHVMLQQQIAEHPLLAALIHIGIITIGISTGIPGMVVLILAGGMLFGGWYGALLSSIGVTCGALVLYGASRFAFGEHGESGAPALVERLRGGYQDHPVSYTFFLRLVPFFPFGGVTVALAWLRCPLWLFALATAFGGSLMTTIESLLGAGLAMNLEHDGKLDASLFSDPWVLGPSFCLALMALIPIAINRWRKARPGPPAPPPQH